MALDPLIKNGTVVDGSGMPRYRADGGVAGGQIGYRELAVTGKHAIAIGDLPPLHKDPFDRILVAQSVVQGITLLTSDPLVEQYPAPVRRA